MSDFDNTPTPDATVMRLTDRITTAINRWERWIEDRPRPLALCPLRVAASVALLCLLIASNVLALIRWPCSAVARLLHSSHSLASGEPISASAEQLERLLEGDLPVLVDFWAEWCGPCLLMNGVLTDFAKQFEGNIIVAKVDATLNPRLTNEHHIGGLPTLLLFNSGDEQARHVGPLGYRELVDFVVEACPSLSTDDAPTGRPANDSRWTGP